MEMLDLKFRKQESNLPFVTLHYWYYCRWKNSGGELCKIYVIQWSTYFIHCILWKMNILVSRYVMYWTCYTVTAKSLQSCLTLCNPIDGSPPGSPVPGILQARILYKLYSGLPFPSPMHESEKWKVKLKLFSRVRLLATPWTAAYQAPLSMGFSRQEYWSGLSLPSPIDSLVESKFLSHSQSSLNPLWAWKGHSSSGDK